MISEGLAKCGGDRRDGHSFARATWATVVEWRCSQRENQAEPQRVSGHGKFDRADRIPESVVATRLVDRYIRSVTGLQIESPGWLWRNNEIAAEVKGKGYLPSGSIQKSQSGVAKHVAPAIRAIRQGKRE
jgi:hypothetical protein